MVKYIYSISFIVFFCFVKSCFSPVYAGTFSVAAIDWCPQICTDKENPGYIIEIIEAVFEDSPYRADINFYPWSRAIMLTKRGQVLALLSPAKSEAPTLRFPKEAVGNQRMCFFTLAESSWQYNGPKSLKGMQIGLATDASIEELNSYLKEHPEQFQFQPYHERYIKQSAGKLDRHRIDSFIFTHNSTIFEFNRLGIQKKYRNAGCVNTTNIYMAFTNNDEVTQEVTKMMALFDEKINDLHKLGKIAQIMKKYHLSSWR